MTYDNYNIHADDALDRLTNVSYGMDSTTESFTYDDLGNRDSVTLRDTSTDDYVIDANNNRYASVDGNSLAYNAAGDLTIDKDDYDFEYDYENRITKIEDTNSATVAEFAYDALGRRIRKIADSVTALYYHNNNWQVLAETNSGGTTQRWYIYGNYIDEPLRMTDAGSGDSYYYIHDHLYSPVALVDEDGDVVERYEYDAYGNARVLDADFTADADGLSDYGNPYLFTGRRVDVLDGGNLPLQYNRNRYYDPYTGRWYTPDPLGITPNPQAPNVFDPERQYADGGNLYEYVGGRPVDLVDSWGLKIKVYTRALDLSFLMRLSGYWVSPAIFGYYDRTTVHCVLIVESCNNGTKETKTWDFQNDSKIYSPAREVKNRVRRPKTAVIYSKDDKDDIVKDIANSTEVGEYNGFSNNCCHWVENVLSDAGLKWKNPNPWPFN